MSDKNKLNSFPATDITAEEGVTGRNPSAHDFTNSTAQLVTAANPPGEKNTHVAGKNISIHSLLKGLVKHKASDLHVKVGRPPMYRINGKLLPAKLPSLSSEDVKNLAYSTMNSKQIREFEEGLQIDFGYLVPGLARFRANVFMQKGTLAFVIRVVPLEVPVLTSLNLPPIVAELALMSRGLLLVTGATGSGKSTTLAAIVEHINRNTRSHIVSIEDPIEFIFEDKMSTVSQREVGVDAVSMQSALKGALRQDPDVIMVGEMRDFSTIQTAITAAETGHLVLSTLHTNTAAQSIDRILDSFPADAKNQLRLQLSSSILGVITQRLVRRADGNGRVAACEILTKSPTVEKLIVDNRVNDLDTVMESSNLYYKMQSMNQALEKLVRDGVITQEEALLNSDKKEDLVLKLSGMVSGSSSTGSADGGVFGQAENEIAVAVDTDVRPASSPGPITAPKGGMRSLPQQIPEESGSGIQVEGHKTRAATLNPFKKKPA